LYLVGRASEIYQRHRTETLPDNPGWVLAMRGQACN